MVVRGPNSPLIVAFEDFDLICTEGDRNNMGSIRGRYNAMLAQAAYDSAPPRAMAMEDLPHPAPVHVFRPRQSQQSGRVGTARAFYLVWGAATKNYSTMGVDV